MTDTKGLQLLMENRRLKEKIKEYFDAKYNYRNLTRLNKAEKALREEIE